MQTQRLPVEIILHVLEDVEHDLAVRLDELRSPFYWCIPASVLRAAWAQRRYQQRLLWSRSIPPLCQINSMLREYMTNRLKVFKTPPTLRSFGRSKNCHARSVALSATTFYNHRSLTIFADDRIPFGTWRFIGSRNETWESLNFDMDLGNSQVSLGIYKFHMPRLPSLRSFTLRLADTQHWLDHLVLRTLVETSPKLINLTIFHLQGASLVSDNELKPACSLKSLHIRRFRECSQDTVGYLVSNSHQSLEELTIVLDGGPRPTGVTQRFYRGIGAGDLQAALAPCLELRTLRFADRVARLWDYEDLEERELDPDFGPLGFILDDMVKKLHHLQVLKIWGEIFSMTLFDNLNIAGCQLTELSIQSYPGLPMPIFLENLRTNPALSMLEILQIGSDTLPIYYASSLQAACQDLGIQMQILFENVNE
ncbi:hypothetical protein O181_058710 [Austropuccinia psidii MF-1]|uniref:Uncharacterized protein n=1 Tax=Austropuccinia psidii MF-1 TaxID=1389203 RepID=A0A9Q3HY39_9BASI|nr:hypothetical protein [Austropuccinia psidii MF-1]